MSDIALVISFVVLASMICQWLAWRAKLPAILFLLITGLLVGPVLNWIEPDAMFGELLMPMVSLSVAIILFEGSLTLKLKEMSEIGRVVQRMISVGALVTWLVVGVAAYFIFGFSWQVSALFGSIAIVTGPTVVVPMLRSVRPSRKIANILRWEGIAIDPIGALMAVMTYEFILASTEHAAIGHVIWVFFGTVATGLIIGLLAGYALGRLLVLNWIPEYLHNLAALSTVLVAFSLSNHFQHESGLLAVTVMGMWLANKDDLDIHPILNFKENLSVLLISMLFIVLAARIDLAQLLAIGGKALALLFVLQFIARPAKIFVSTFGLDVNWREKALLSWIAPRGIVAAAISAIFANRLVEVGYDEAVLLVPLTFSVIIGTVVLQSATSSLLARWLGVAEPAATGFLIVGANAFARALAKELVKFDCRCVLVDSNWDNIRQARMIGLETFYGNPVSDHADVRLDLSGIGNLLALSHQNYINVIAAIHYGADFGERRIFRLGSSADAAKSEKHTVSNRHQGAQLFGKEITYGKMVSAISSGEAIKSTTLREEFDWATYVDKYGSSRLPLFVVSKKGLVQPFLADEQREPPIGSTILALTNSSAVEKAEAEPSPESVEAPGQLLI